MPSSNSQWRKSSYSNGMGGECLEMAALAEGIAVRDSKVTSGPQLTVSRVTWKNFIGTIAQAASRVN
ncbi:hypothetical protein GCM10010276_50550 [Streptomyces longisporus]|uniref:DUF397 domain-containing protein n=2 Tax=Streptomyces longisporus TaxID=1948 RepID=A0ABP5ZVX7_STRLO